MGAHQRRKGAVGEREFAALMRTHGMNVSRAFQEQCRSGGADLDGIPGWFVEVKRDEANRLSAWWAKCVRLAAALKQRPAIAWRRNGEQWRVLVALTPEEFARLIREPIKCDARKHDGTNFLHCVREAGHFADHDYAPADEK